MKLTLDSSEPLEDAIRVLGALYGVTLVVAGDEPDPGQPLRSIEQVDPGELTEQGEPDEPAETSSAKRMRRPTTGKKSRTRPRAADADGDGAEQSSDQLSPEAPSNAELRSWARENGFTVRDRGRVPASVLSAYRNAHGE